MKTWKLIFIISLLSSNLFGQYEPDRHSTNYYDAWISCEQSMDPIEKWGERHWIKYEFDAIYVLGKMTIWNYNDREHNGYAVRDVIIDYSIDGETWEEWGLYTFDEVSETSFYQGDQGPDFDGLEARYIVLTVLSNYGGGPCVGIGEIKIETTGWSPTSTHAERNVISTRLTPNPAQIQTKLTLELNSLEPITMTIIDQQGKRVKSWEVKPSALNHEEMINTSNLLTGTYYIYINQNDKVSSKKLIIIK